MHVGVGGAIKRARSRAPVKILNEGESGTAHKGEIEIKPRDECRRNVSDVSRFQASEGHGCVDVIESGDTASAARDPVGEYDSVGNIGAEDHEIRIGDYLLEAQRYFLDLPI